MPEAEWFAIRVAIWGCVAAEQSSAVAEARTRRGLSGGQGNGKRTRLSAGGQTERRRAMFLEYGEFWSHRNSRAWTLGASTNSGALATATQRHREAQRTPMMSAQAGRREGPIALVATRERRNSSRCGRRMRKTTTGSWRCCTVCPVGVRRSPMIPTRTTGRGRAEQARSRWEFGCSGRARRSSSVASWWSVRRKFRSMRRSMHCVPGASAPGTQGALGTR